MHVTRDPAANTLGFVSVALMGSLSTALHALNERFCFPLSQVTSEVCLQVHTTEQSWLAEGLV